MITFALYAVPDKAVVADCWWQTVGCMFNILAAYWPMLYSRFCRRRSQEVKAFGA